MATYKVIHINWQDSLSKEPRVYGRHEAMQDLSEAETVQQALDKWATAGWELVTASARGEGQTRWDHLLYFRKG
jgi:hypothetical protein